MYSHQEEDCLTFNFDWCYIAWLRGCFGFFFDLVSFAGHGYYEAPRGIGGCSGSSEGETDIGEKYYWGGVVVSE